MACLLACASTPVMSQELLSNGNFDLGLADVFTGWEIQEFFSNGNPDPVDAVNVIGFANQAGEIAGENGVWLRSFLGGNGTVSDGANGVITQTVAATAGQSYTLKGNSLFEQNYSGGVITLDPLSPSGAIPTPTKNFYEIEFLDAGNNVIGTPASLDLFADGQFSGGGWFEQDLTAVAPVGTTQARIVLKATDMVFNVDPSQTAFYDNFSFTEDSAPSTELLTNGDMNDFSQEVPDWDIVETPVANDTVGLEGFANNTPGGSHGIWLRAFAEGDANVSQTVAGSPGTEYEFSAYSFWEEFYSGGQGGSGTETKLELAFLDGSESVIGTPIELDLSTEQMNDFTWRQHTVSGTAPAGTAFVRVSGIATGMVNTEGAQSAFFDDFSLMAIAGGLDGDFNDDGSVDAADYTVYRDNLGLDSSVLNGNGSGAGTVVAADYALWAANFGNTSSSATAAAVPEPSTLVLATMLGLFVAGRAKRV